MNANVQPSPASRQANSLASRRTHEDNRVATADHDEDKSLVPADAHEDEELVLYRQDLRDAIEESGEKKEFVAAAMGLKDPSYLSKLFSGEKPITSRHITGLPDHVEQIFERKRAQRRGLIVVEPVSGPQAVANLVSGLVGVLGPALPAKADRMVRAELPLRPAKAGIR